MELRAEERNHRRNRKQEKKEARAQAKAKRQAERRARMADPKRRVQGPAFLRFMRIAAIVFLVLAGLFMAAVVKFDVLPASKLTLALAAVGTISAVLALLMLVKGSRKWLKIVSLALAVLLSTAYIYGYSQFRATDKFFDALKGFDTQKATYVLVANKKSGYTFPASFKGAKVATYATEDKTYGRAMDKLNKLCSVNFDRYGDLSMAAAYLTNGSYKAMYMSKDQYDSLCAKDEALKKSTKVAYKVSVNLNDDIDLKPVDVRKQPFNIYITGLDVYGPIETASRSDVNMVVTVNPKTQKVLLTSIPRDTHVTLPDKDGAKDKLTHTGLYGVSETIGAAEGLLGTGMNYYVKVNYKTVIRFINAIGGVDVNSDYDFTTSGMAAHYHFKKGKNHLTGRKALAFARERHSFPDGDLQRNRDQQKIMQAVIKKLTSSSTLLFDYADILKSCEGYVQISMTGEEMKSLIKMQLANNYDWKVSRQGLKGNGASEQCYSTGSAYVYVLEPDEASLTKVKQRIDRVMAGK